jgi:hypothetical protein
MAQRQSLEMVVVQRGSWMSEKFNEILEKVEAKDSQPSIQCIRRKTVKIPQVKSSRVLYSLVESNELKNVFIDVSLVRFLGNRTHFFLLNRQRLMDQLVLLQEISLKQNMRYL